MQNNSSSLFSTEYSPLPQKLFPHKTYKNKELRQLKKFKTDKEVKLNLSSTDIHFCKNIPTLVSMFVFDNVYIYDILSDQLVTKFPMINEAITVGAMRNDGKVVLSGTESGKIIVHDVINKNVLRKYSAHTLDVNSIDIDDSLVKFASASKDCSFFIYELASKTPIREYKKSHSDYIKSVRFANCDSVLTGGFDKKIKLWDIRENSTNPVMEFDNGNICNHIHLPVQSGSNSVLKAMNRKYTREWYLDRIAAIRRMIPDCGISTDMFTGFHGETEEDFEQTLSLMRKVGFDSAFMFKYSERPGTFASKFLPDNVAEEVKIERLNRMIALENELSLESNRRDVGKTFEILVEGYSKRSRSDMFGRTQQNKVVVFPARDEKPGDFITVKVNSVSSATLLGERID